LIARRPYNVAKSIHLNLDYRISGRRHSPGLYPRRHFHFRFPVTRAVQKTDGPILTIHTSYDVFLRKKMPFGVAMIAPALEFSVP